MDHHGQSELALDSRQHGQNGRQSRSGIERLALVDHAESNRRIADELRRTRELHEAQQKRSRSFTSLFTTSISHAGQLFGNLHLAEESAIQSVCVENASTVSTLTLYEGSGGSGRVIAIIRPSKLKRIPIADHISSLSLVADKPDPGPAIVFVTLTTHKWSPTESSIV
jgi:hypothetical protein